MRQKQIDDQKPDTRLVSKQSIRSSTAIVVYIQDNSKHGKVNKATRQA